MASNSPYDGFENAVLTFSVRGSASIDPATGNPVEAITTTAVDALLKIKRDPDWQGRQGIDLTRTYMEGNLVDPQFLPAGVALPARVPCVRAGVVGEFQLLPIIRDPWGVWEETGDPIRGYFYQGGYQ